MTQSLYAIPATLCLAAAVVTAQAPAGDKPASYPPAAQQPAAQPTAGQQPSTGRPSTSSPSSQQTSTMAGNKITYVGCIKPGTTTGAWVLENAEAQKAGATGSRAVGTSGGSTMTLTLDPAPTVNLKAHANHKVEIVGMMSTQLGATAAAGPKSGEAEAGVTGPTDAKGEAGTPGAAGGAGGAGAPGAAGARASGHHFSVESLKMVSGTCP
jgi:pilus assembly protein FimV